MEKLRVRIIFKSGRITEITSHNYYKGQFKEWCYRNFIKNEWSRYDFVLWNDCLINVNEIEKVEEIE